jgi:SSS family solute:Na+ symporter
MICDHYGSSVLLRSLVALVGFLYAIPYVVIQLDAGGLVSATIFPDDSGNAFLYGTYALAGVTVIYIMIGGMRSVAWTDVIQGFMLIGGMLLAGVAAIAALGGIGKFL